MSGLLKTEVRDGFKLTGTPKMLCCKHGNSRVKVSLWPFCGRIPGPTDTIRGQVLKAKNFNGCCQFAGRTGWPDFYKKNL